MPQLLSFIPLSPARECVFSLLLHRYTLQYWCLFCVEEGILVGMLCYWCSCCGSQWWYSLSFTVALPHTNSLPNRLPSGCCSLLAWDSCFRSFSSFLIIIYIWICSSSAPILAALTAPQSRRPRELEKNCPCVGLRVCNYAFLKSSLAENWEETC